MASSKIALGVFLGLSAYGLLHSYHNFDALYYTASDWMIGLVEPPKPAVQQVSYQVPGSPRLSLGPVPDSSRFSEPSTGSSLAPQCIKPGNVIDQDSLACWRAHGGIPKARWSLVESGEGAYGAEARDNRQRVQEIQARETNCRWWRLHGVDSDPRTVKENLERYCR
jgi:hypothetical protein